MPHDISHRQKPGSSSTPWTTRRMLTVIVIALLLGGGVTNVGISHEAGLFNKIVSLIKKIISPPPLCSEFCALKVQFVDASTGQKLTGIQAGSFVDFDLVINGVTRFSGIRTINSDGTFTLSGIGCVPASTSLQNVKIIPFGGSIKATAGCPAGQCRTWAIASGSISLQGMEGCTPVVRVPVTTSRPCRNC